MDFGTHPTIAVTPAAGSSSALDDLSGLWGSTANGLSAPPPNVAMAPSQNFDLDGLLNRPPSPTPVNPLPPTPTTSFAQSANNAQYHAQFNQVASVMATATYPYQQQAQANQPFQAGMVGGQPGMVGGQGGMIGIMGNQGGIMGGQTDIMGNHGGIMGGQTGIIGNQGGMMGGQTGIMGMQSQGGMMGNQGGMMGMQSQAGMMPGGGMPPMGDPRLSSPLRAAPIPPAASFGQPGWGASRMNLPHAPPQLAPAPPPPMSIAPPPPSSMSIAPVHDSLILSASFTEPGPISPDQDPLADPLGALADPSVKDEVIEPPEATATFYIDETDTGEVDVEETSAEEKEEGKEEEEKEQEAAPPQRRSFFSRFARSKEGGSQEQILEEKEKEPETEKGRGGNEQKFLGDGQSFKGKLIGVLEVREARGDRMCQDALQELKMAIKASGEHKQKVNIQIAVDGLKIRDEKSGDCLYHHPVHKISFIAQDMTDNRAFGYIYGSPENGHRFFGIKSEKAAGQVVVAMRDLFQVVFELKKKEIDEAKQNIEKIGVAAGESKQEPTTSAAASSAATFPDGPAPSTTTTNAIDDLLGLENEISAIQAGIQQIDKITPSAPMSFQTDSMLPLHIKMPEAATLPPPQSQAGGTATKPRPVAVMNNGQQKPDMFGAAPFLPPPPKAAVRRQEGDRYAVFDAMQPRPVQAPQTAAAAAAPTSGSFNILQTAGSGSQPPSFMSTGSAGSEASGGRPGDLGVLGVPTETGANLLSRAADPGMAGLIHNSSPNFQTSAMGPQVGFNSNHDLASLFTDLDPLGSGKAKPFVDKKDFFSDSKTSPKMNSVPQDSHMTHSVMPENPYGGGLL